MDEITINEMKAILKIFKSFNRRYNANNLSKDLGLTSMGTLKILRKLYQKNILKLEELGKAKYYSINFENKFAVDYIIFLLKKESNEAIPRLKRWINEANKLKNISKIGVLFGSVLRSDKYNDVDMLLVFIKKNNSLINSQIKEINEINITHIHPIKQIPKDFRNNLAKKDKVVMQAIRTGIVIFGFEEYVKVIKDYSR